MLSMGSVHVGPTVISIIVSLSVYRRTGRCVKQPNMASPPGMEGNGFERASSVGGRAGLPLARQGPAVTPQDTLESLRGYLPRRIMIEHFRRHGLHRRAPAHRRAVHPSAPLRAPDAFATREENRPWKWHLMFN